MSYGYNGKILRVDQKESIGAEEPQGFLYCRFLGGGTLALYYLSKEFKPKTGPLEPKIILVFSGSVISGTRATGLSHFSVAAKSPLTGGFGEAETGGWWIPELKFAGFDAIVILAARRMRGVGLCGPSTVLQLSRCGKARHLPGQKDKRGTSG